MAQKILINGANGGFGKLIVKTLVDRGHKVVASMHDISGRNKANADEFKTMAVDVVDIDVTNNSSVQKGVNAAVQAAGGLDAVINNAGVGVLGLQEMFTADDLQKLFDINVFVVQRVNKAALPHLREKKSGLLQNPQNVADAVADVIEKEPGTRPFRTVVDKMGMGDHIVGHNDQLHNITSGIYNAFGIGHMLELQK